MYEMVCNQVSFEEAVLTDIVSILKSFQLGPSSIELIVDLIFEGCVSEPNSHYSLGQLCGVLSHSTGGLLGFRSIFLNKAQKEFGKLNKALNGTKKEITRALNFSQFMAILFLNLNMVDSDGNLVRFSVLGRAILGVVEQLIKYSGNSDCIQCAASVLELTIIPLEEALQDDGKESLTRLGNILHRIGTMKNHQLPKFHILIKLHFNRMLKKS
uniref:Polyadenylate-binding protein-interacting protein 1 n=2 Tax=Ciona intestinalis TaxID=7719 RepID=F7BEQ8_CIOIN